MPRFVDRSTGVTVTVSDAEAEHLDRGNYTPEQPPARMTSKPRRRRKTEPKPEAAEQAEDRED